MLERSSQLKITSTKILADIEMVKQDAMRLTAENQTMNNHQAVLKACELQGRHIQMFVDKVELEVTDNLSERMQRAREREKQAD
jgi:hypothetical protein